MLHPDARLWRWAAVALWLGAGVVVTVTAADYGYNVDEWFASRHGKAIADWYAAWIATGEFRDFESPVIAGMNHYGGFFELLGELASRISPLSPTRTRFLLAAWFGVLGLAAAYGLGASLHSRAAGFLAMLFLLLTPRYYGHFFHNTKDIPFATCTAFALLAIVRALPALPRLSPGRIFALGGAIGAGMGLRVGGMASLAYLALGLGWWLGGETVRARRRGGLPEGREVFRVAASGLAVVAVAWCVMLLFWPWAQSAPLARPLSAAGYFLDILEHQGIAFRVFFEGRDYALGDVPRIFTLRWLSLSLPEFMWLLPVALVPAGRWLRDRRGQWPDARAVGWGLLGVSILLPLALTLRANVLQYDGIRHFLFVLPPLCVILAGGLVATASALPSRALRILGAGVTGLLAALSVWDMRALHPYQYVYFNRSVAGGLAASSARFETDYLGLSYREGVRWVLEHVDPPAERRLRIAACPGFWPNLEDGLQTDPERARRFRVVEMDDAPDLVVAFTRSHCHERTTGEVLWTVERGGVPLLYVIKRPTPETREPGTSP